MVKFELLKEKGILIAEPHGPLSKDDFANIAAAVFEFLWSTFLFASLSASFAQNPDLS